MRARESVGGLGRWRSAAAAAAVTLTLTLLCATAYAAFTAPVVLDEAERHGGGVNYPSVATGPDGDARVVWLDNLGRSPHRLQLSTISSDGEVTAPRQISVGRPSAYAPSIATGAGGASIVAWYWAYIADVRLEGVAVRTISASGAVGPVRQLQDDCLLPGPPAVATDADGDSIVAWECYYQPSNSRPHIVARTVAADGTVSPLRVLGNTDRGGHACGCNPNPEVAVDADGDSLVVWRGEDGRVQARPLTASGIPGPLVSLTAPRNYREPLHLDHGNPVIAMSPRRARDRGMAPLLRGRPRRGALDPTPQQRPRAASSATRSDPDRLPRGIRQLPRCRNRRRGRRHHRLAVPRQDACDRPGPDDRRRRRDPNAHALTARGHRRTSSAGRHRR